MLFFHPDYRLRGKESPVWFRMERLWTNMFAGVGMFSIMAAKRKKCTVYSIDINPVASNLCEKNIRSEQDGRKGIFN